MDRIDRATSAATLVAGLRAGQEAGEIIDVPLDALAGSLSAVFDRAALDIVNGASREAYLEVIAHLIGSLRR